jgi:hypothetical protein
VVQGLRRWEGNGIKGVQQRHSLGNGEGRSRERAPEVRGTWVWAPLHERAGHSWRQVPENGVGRSRERAPEAGGAQAWAPLEKRRGRSRGQAPEAWGVQVWAPFKKLGASAGVENKGAVSE